MGKLLVFITPLLNESTSNRAHHAQEEAEKQHDIGAKGATWGATGTRGVLTTAWLERLVDFNDK